MRGNGERHPARDKLAYALDFPSFAQAEEGAARVAHAAGVLKVGLELFVSEGPRAVALGQKLGCDVFLDLKLHDIPETVERAVAAAAAHGVRYLTLHAAGGPKMLAVAARRAEREFGGLGPFTADEVAALVAHAFIGAESHYLLGLEKKGVPVRPALRRFGDLIRILETAHRK